MSSSLGRKGRGGERGGTRRGKNGRVRGDSRDSGVAGLSCARACSPGHCVGEGKGRGRCGAGDMDGVMGTRAAPGGMYHRRESGLGRRARGGVCAVIGIYGPWRRVMPLARVSTLAGGAVRRGRGRSHAPHRDVVSGSGVAGRTCGPHCDGLAFSSLAPPAQALIPRPSLSTLLPKAAAYSSMSIGSSCQYCLGGDPCCRWACRSMSRTR